MLINSIHFPPNIIRVNCSQYTLYKRQNGTSMADDAMSDRLYCTVVFLF